MKWSAPAFVAVLTTASACGPATGPTYPGQPLFTISGQMTTEGAAPKAPIRLAVAWYADHATLGGPQAIVTQDVQYQGTFPLDYTFSFFGPPPESALNVITLDGATFRASWGVLIAYEDLNRNGQLDTIPAGTAPVDRILATSIGNLFNGEPSPNPIRVAYIDGVPPASLTGYVAGYNLYGQKQDTAVSSNSPATLPLSDGASASELDLFVCPDFVTGAYLASPNSNSHSPYDLPCIIPPSGGVRVAGSLILADGVPTAWIRVTDGTNPLQAAVTWNGTALTYSPADQAYEGTGSSFDCGDGGVEELTVVLADGGGTHTFLATKPADFAISTPSSTVVPRFLAGTPIAVDWTSEAAGAVIYTLSLISTLPPYGDDLQKTTAPVPGPNQALTLTTPAIDGPEWLTVFAATSDQPVFGHGGSVLFPGTYRSAYLDLAPADAGLGAFGYLFQVHDAIHRTDFSETLLQVDEGSVPLSKDAAAVSVNDHPVVWSQVQSGYSYNGRTILDAGAVSQVEVTVEGLGAFEAAVPVPGPMAVLQPVGPVAPGDLLNLSWTPSTGAVSYNVLVEALGDGGSRIPLTEVSTADTSLSLVMPSQADTGSLFLSVYALGPQPNRHFSGAYVEQLEVVVSGP